MKRKVRIIALCLVTMMIVLALTGCGESKQSRAGENVENMEGAKEAETYQGAFANRYFEFVRTWLETDAEGNQTGDTLVLSKNGEGTLTGDQGISENVQWSVEKNQLFLTVVSDDTAAEKAYTYKLTGKKLVLTDEDGNTVTYFMQ